MKRQEKQAQTRAALLEAAGRVFARRGYHAAKLEEIAAEADLTTGAIYSNFTGKENLFLALADAQVDKRRAEIGAILDQPADPATLAIEGAQRFRAFIEHDPDWPLLYFEFWAYGVRTPHLREEFATRRRAVQGVIADVIGRVEEGLGLQLPYPTEQVAVGLSAAINGLAFERVADPGAVPDDLFAFMVSSLATAVFAAATPRPASPPQPGRPDGR
jgi:AcrR family transcriptional regulator